MFRPAVGAPLRPRSAAPTQPVNVERVEGHAKSHARITVDGKYFQLNGQRWVARGLTYGPFAPNESGEFLPAPSQVAKDFAQIRALGANAVRVYHVPPRWLL